MVYKFMPQKGDEMIKAATATLSLVLLSMLTGSSLQIHFGKWLTEHATPNTSEYLAFNAPAQVQQEEQSQQTVNALTAAQITALDTSVQADRDDRKALHDQIYQLTQTEAEHYNTLVDRLNVDEARLSGGISVAGGLLIILNGIAVLSHLLSWRDKRKAAQNEGK